MTVANVETYRGFLSLTPTASPVDGLFDVFVQPRASGLELNLRLLSLLLKAPGRWDGVVLCRGRHVTVTVNSWRTETLRVVRGALPLLLPRGSLETLARRTRHAHGRVERLVTEAGWPSGRRAALVGPGGRAHGDEREQADDDPRRLPAAAYEREGEPGGARETQGGEGRRVRAL